VVDTRVGVESVEHVTGKEDTAGAGDGEGEGAGGIWIEVLHPLDYLAVNSAGASIWPNPPLWLKPCLFQQMIYGMAEAMPLRESCGSACADAP